MPSSTGPSIKCTPTRVGGKADRTEFKRLLLEAYQQKFDLVVFWHLDRFSCEGSMATLPEGAEDRGVDYKSYAEPCPNSLRPCGDVIISMLAAIAAQDLNRRY